MDLMTYALCKGNGGGGGGSSNVLVVGATFGDENAVLDKTWQEIYDADYAIYSPSDGNGKISGVISLISNRGGVYYVQIAVPYVNDDGTAGLDGYIYTASSANDYPTWTY